jgi:photosystem II stability/assembly factor-like uncharacterized protein
MTVGSGFFLTGLGKKFSIDWTAQTSGLDNNPVGDVTDTGSKLVVVSDSGIIASSTDGESWTTKDTGIGDLLLDGILTDTNGDIYLAGDNGTILKTTDLATFTAQTNGAQDDELLVTKILRTPSGSLLAACDSGTMLKNLTTKITAAKVGSSHLINGIAANDTTTVICAQAGKISYSTDDGSTYTAATTGVTSNIAGVRWIEEKSLFVALANSGILLTSPDGITWTIIDTGLGDFQLFDACCHNGLYVIVADNGHIITSVALSDFLIRKTSGTVGLYRIIWSDLIKAFVVVGDNGTILTGK